MSGRYAACGAGAIAGTPGTTVMYVAAATTHRVKLYDWLFGTSAAADDNTIINTLERFTAVPTGGSEVTPVALDPADGGVLSSCTQNATTGTISGCLLAIPTNQRASHRWVAAPDGELVVPASNFNGITYRAVHGSITHNMQTTFHWLE